MARIPYREMALDQGDWWPKDEKIPSRPIRYQIAVLGPTAMLRIEGTPPGDIEGTTGQTWGMQVGLQANDCRLLARHLLEIAELLERAKRPMN